jgi:hypothetical protein
LAGASGLAAIEEITTAPKLAFAPEAYHFSHRGIDLSGDVPSGKDMNDG